MLLPAILAFATSLASQMGAPGPRSAPAAQPNAIHSDTREGVPSKPLAELGPAGLIPKSGNLPGARRQQADRSFLAQRGISYQAPGGRGATSAPAQKLRTAIAQHQRLLGRAALSPASGTTPGTWQSQGPAQVNTAAYGEVTGRITSLAADPNDTTGNTLYVGATGGGVWKSTNAAGSVGSVTFAPLTDVLPAFSNTLGSLSIGAVSVQPTASSVILAGTGDPNDALDSYYGVGILRSTDGGNTWSLIGGSRDAQAGGLQNYSFIGNGFAGFAWSSANPSLVVAAVAQSLEGELVNAGSSEDLEAGLYYSSDAGQTWYLAVIEDASNAIVQSPNRAGSAPGNSATSVVWNPVRQRFYAAVRFHGYYESTDGITWTRLANQPGSSLAASACPTNPGGVGQTSCPIFRGALAVQPVTGDMFALTTDLNNLDQGLFHDVCSQSGLAVSSCASSTVAFGTQIPSGALEAGAGDTTIPLADYDLTLTAVALQQDTILFAGTEDIFRCSLANSCAWRNTTNIETCASAMVAPSQHATEATFGANGLVYFANDGGLWRSTDDVAQTGSVCASTDASHYQNLNGGIGSLAEITHFSVSPASAQTLLAGMGGFGTVGTINGAGAWQQLLTGEGSYTAIDPANLNNWYAEAGSGVDIFRCTAGAGCNAAGFGTNAVIGRSQIEDDADYFEDPAPWILDPLNTANVLLGSCRVWRGPATGGSGWSGSNILSPMLDGNQQPSCTSNAQLRSVGAGVNASAAGTEQMYAGMAGPYDGGGATPGHVFTSTVPAAGGLTTWSDLWNSPVTNSPNDSQFNEGGFAVSSIAVDPHDATGHTLYVTMQGFSGNGISNGEVYGSTDAGAHWTNLTNNLPLAPANSVVVDPNAPSILYVALDTGVYYTENVAACANPAQSCWAVYGAGLPNAPVTELEIYSAGASSILEAATYGRGIWALGLTTAPSQGTLSPPSYTFAGQQVSTSSAATIFTLANTGSSTMAITAVTLSGDYAETNDCGQSLAAYASCTLQVTFTPTVAGDRTGTLTVFANVSGGQLASTLDGAGLAPGNVTVTPSSLSFPSTVTGASSAVEGATVQNTGGIAVQLGAFSTTTDYQLSSNSCGSTLAPGASCAVGITFTPSATGDRPGHLSIASNVAGSPTLVPLDGTGVSPPALTLSPTSLSFPNTAQGAVSATRGITVTSSGGAPAQIQSMSIAGDYQIASTSCGSTLAPGMNCVLNIDFAPASTGARAGLLTIQANVSGGQVTAPLNGTGVTPPALSLTPGSLIFPQTTQGVSSAGESIHLTSTGGASVQLGSLSVSGDYAISGSSCGASLAPGASCALQIVFTPTTTGDRPGLLTVPANIAGGQATATLDGTGLSPPQLYFTPGSLTFGSVAVGSTSSAQSFEISNLGGTAAQVLTPTTTGDFSVSANSCGSSIAPGTNCTLQVTFSPTAIGTRTGVLTLSGTNFSAVRATLRPAGLLVARAEAAPASTGQVSGTMSGTGVAPPVVVMNPSPLIFSTPIPAGSASTAQAVTVMNNGSIAATLQAPSITGNFQITSTTCGSSLAAQASCVINVIFHPQTAGALSGSLILSGSMSGGQVTDTLEGSGLGPGVLTLTPGNLNYAATVVGSASTPVSVQVKNTSANALTLPPATITGDYLIANNGCGSSLGAGQSCVIQITFDPTTPGDRPGQLLQSDGVQTDATQVVTLDGTGLAPGALTPAMQAFNFPTMGVGSSSSPQTFTVTNTGGAPVHFQSAMLTGANAGDFSIPANSCTGTLAVNAPCSVQVVFTPSTTGARTATLTLVSDASNSPATVSLGGTGVAAANVTLTPGSYNFGSGAVVGSTSSAVTFTATNSGGVPAQLSGASFTGDYRLATGSTCGAMLPAAGGSCTLQVVFAPTAAGDRPGTLSLTGQFSNAPATASLDGQAVAAGALTLSPSSLNFGSLTTETSSPSAPVMVTNSGGVAVQLGAISVAGAYRETNNCPAALAPAATCTVQIVFAPSATGDQFGLLSVTGNFPGSPATATLDGMGVAPGALSLSTPFLSYGPVTIGASSAAQALTVTNTGGASLALQAPVVGSAEYLMTANSCGTMLGAGQQCMLSLVFRPTAAGDQTTSVVVSASGAAPVQATLDGTGLRPAVLVFAPSSLSFGSVVLSKTPYPTLGSTLTNTGGAAAQLHMPVVVGDYAIVSNSCGASLGMGASCKLQISFDPSASGQRTGSVTVADTNSPANAVLFLGGTATPPPSLVLTPTSLTFSATGLGATTAAQNIVVANIGSAAVTLQAPAITGDFAISADNCSGTPLQPQYSCPYSITFSPTAGGQRTGLLTVSDGTETHTATLTGTGLSPATDTLSTTSLSFGPQVFGTVSPAQSVSITNSGGSTLGALSVTATGPFIAANNCGTMLGGGLSCSIAVSFAPIGAGAETGILTIVDAARTQTVSLAGQGVLPPQAVATPISLSYGGYAVGITSPAQLVTMTNNGKTALTNFSAAVGTTNFQVASNTCGGTIAAGASCTLGVTFTAPLPGNFNDQLTLSSPSLNGDLTVALSGSGEDFQLSISGSSSDLVTNGQTASYQVVVTPVGSTAGTLTLTCTGAPANSSCTANPTAVTLSGGATGSVTVTIATGLTKTTGAARAPGLPGTGERRGVPWRAGAALALLLPCLVLRGGARRSWLVLLVAVALVVAPTACGVHASGGSSSTSGSASSGTTPPGKYSITITGSFPGAQRTQVVTLTVE